MKHRFLWHPRRGQRRKNELPEWLVFHQRCLICVYIMLQVHHLIEKCMTFGMSMEECMEALAKRADVQPVVTSTVWKELEKENKDFFDRYKQLRAERDGRGSSNSSS
ncbi:hypothetical protein QYE76_068919 [Lolium multiflorum]|uniref:Uncharacterized protein n=1 Tax=Lolium multiflorum TaxID=4521 RepID=A0AAD8SG84_LOLMU|nr:hypothetical protein QYE76_068919 [Lolium multiflorum]